MEVLFWFSCFMLFYTVALYPFLLMGIGLFIRKRIVRDEQPRKVALVVPVHNGENEIEEKLKNCLALEYPREMLEIHVVSDGSTDRTVDIVRRYHEKGVRCLALPGKIGKVAAQNAALSTINAEIVVFTDVGILVPPSALKDIVSNFADPSIGAVSCRDEIISNRMSQGDSLYIRYDMLIRKYTSMIASLIGVTGGFYAVRWEIAKCGWEPAFPPDFYVALKSIGLGFRVIEDNRVIARYHTPESDSSELERKVRTITRGMWALFSNTALLNPFKYPMVSLQLISHKLLRWLAPLFFIICFTASGFLSLGTMQVYKILFGTQFFFYALGGLGALIVARSTSSISLFSLPRLFFMFNFALILSWKNFITGKKIVQWQPTVRRNSAE